MFNLTNLLGVIGTACDTAIAAKEIWDTRQIDSEDWHSARQSYLATEAALTAVSRRLMRVMKVLARTDTLYLYLDFPVLSSEQRQLLRDTLRANRHERLLNTTENISDDFPDLAHAWKIERDKIEAARELADILQHHDDLESVIRQRALQFRPKGWRLAIRAFRITRELLATQNPSDAEYAAVDAIRSRAEARLAQMTFRIDAILATRLNHRYLLDALLNSVLPVEVESYEDYSDDECESGTTPSASQTRQSDSGSFQERLEEARAVLEAMRDHVRLQQAETKAESPLSIPVKAMDEDATTVDEDAETETENMSAAEIKDLYNLD